MSVMLMLINTKILGYSLYWKMYIQCLMVSDVTKHFLFFINVNHFISLPSSFKQPCGKTNSLN